MIQAKPFLKWAGGKRQLLKDLEKNFPTSIKKSKSIDLYIEPFVGGGALFFYLKSNYSINESIINDINPDLILTYKVIKKFPKQLIKKLETVENEYLKLDQNQRKVYYYEKLRSEYNKTRIDIAHFEKELWIKKATLLIALNKTCFNGLFRQNSKGYFNVPIGKYKNPKILDKENLLNVSQALQDTTILCTNYNKIKIPENKRPFIYFDPPYRPLSTTASFTKYSKGDFDDKDQEELAQHFKDLAEKKYYLLLSNSNPKNSNPEDNFFEELYKDYNIKEISAKRHINSNAKKRGTITELLIKNY